MDELSGGDHQNGKERFFTILFAVDCVNDLALLDLSLYRSMAKNFIRNLR